MKSSSYMQCNYIFIGIQYIHLHTVVSNACCDLNNIEVVPGKGDACWDRSCCHSWTQPQLPRVALPSYKHLALR